MSGQNNTSTQEGARQHLGNALQILADPDSIQNPDVLRRSVQRRTLYALTAVNEAACVVYAWRVGSMPAADALDRIGKLLD